MKLINDLEDLKFRDFIKAQVSGDYSCLILEGNPTEVELRQCWHQLMSQYHELTGNTDALGYLKRLSKIEAYTAKVLHVEAICMSIELAENHSDVREKVLKFLQIWGYSRQFTPESTRNDLKYIRNCNGNDRLKLKKLQIEQQEYEEYEAKKAQKQGKKGGKSDPRKDFLGMLHAIEAHKKMVFDRDKLNMLDFAMYVNDLREYNKEMTIKTRTNGNK